MKKVIVTRKDCSADTMLAKYWNFECLQSSLNFNPKVSPSKLQYFDIYFIILAKSST